METLTQIMNEIINHIKDLPYNDIVIVAVLAYKFTTFFGASFFAFRIAYIKGAPKDVYIMYGLGYLAFLYTFWQSFTLLPVVLNAIHDAPRQDAVYNQIAIVIGCTCIFAATLTKYLKLRKLKLL